MRLVLPHSVEDNSDFSANRLTALVTPLILASQGSSLCYPFSTARILMALHVFVFVFLLMVCLFLSLARLGRLDWFHLWPSSSKSRSQAHHGATSAQAPLPRRLPRLSPLLHLPVCCRTFSCACTSLVRGQKPTGSAQAGQHRRLCLSQSAVPLLREHRYSYSRPRWRWQAWACRAHPDLSRSCLSQHIQCSTRHSLVSSENPLPPGRHSAGCAGRRTGSFRRRAGLRLPASDDQHLAVACWRACSDLARAFLSHSSASVPPVRRTAHQTSELQTGALAVAGD